MKFSAKRSVMAVTGFVTPRYMVMPLTVPVTPGWCNAHYGYVMVVTVS